MRYDVKPFFGGGRNQTKVGLKGFAVAWFETSTPRREEIRPRWD